MFRNVGLGTWCHGAKLTGFMTCNKRYATEHRIPKLSGSNNYKNIVNQCRNSQPTQATAIHWKILTKKNRPTEAVQPNRAACSCPITCDTVWTFGHCRASKMLWMHTGRVSRYLLGKNPVYHKGCHRNLIAVSPNGTRERHCQILVHWNTTKATLATVSTTHGCSISKRLRNIHKNGEPS